MTAARHNSRSAAIAGTSAQHDSVDRDETDDPLRWVWLVLVSGLFFVRWWQPTEGTTLGNTLAIAEGWFLALAMAAWVGIRGTTLRFRADALQWAVWLLVLGQVLSGLMIVFTSGDRRAAINMIWEWLAIGVSFPLLRSILTPIAARREWVVIALAATITLSGYGLTQRYWFYPQMVAEYERMRQELDSLETDQTATDVSRITRLQQLRNDLVASGLSTNMLSGSGRALFEGRLKHSTEALGRFALANTFAGLLVVWWLALVMLGIQQFMGQKAPTADDPAQKRARLLRGVSLVIAALFVGYCLLLTKSRTAYVGACACLAIWTFTNLISRQQAKAAKIRQVLIWGVAALFAFGGLTVVAALTGGLDRMVMAEAPKSLQYRLEYWWSSVQVIREAPLTGVGPGQFRQHYLAHKLPRSSEEIADPHNLILDVWANGGVISLFGTCWLIFLLLRATLGPEGKKVHLPAHEVGASPEAPIPLSRTVRESGTPPSPARKIPQPKIPLRSGTVAPEITAVQMTGWFCPLRWGAAGSMLALWLAGGALDTQLLVFLVLWLVSIWITDCIVPNDLPQSRAWAAIGLGLVVHLCGAGGIAMPAITQLLLLIAVFATPAAAVDTGAILQLWHKWGALLVGLALFGGGYATATQPAADSRWLCDQGDIAQSPGTRERNYRVAMIADPFDPEPCERLAEFSFQKWRGSRDRDDRDFQQAVDAQTEAIERNPFSFHTYRSLGLFYAERARMTGEAEAKANAVKEMQTAVKRYPHNALLLADAANVYALSGETDLAKLTARRALEQDDVNHAAGHTDKWLSDTRRQEMVRLAGQATVGNN